MSASILPTFPVTLVSPQTTDDSPTVQQVVLSDQLHDTQRGLILYFYPKDNTPGCSTQATDFTANIEVLKSMGYEVIGVSRDSVRSHQAFIQAKSINFPLISDADETLCQYFDIIGEKKLYGKVSLGVIRSTLVFDKTGKLIKALRNVRAKDHVKNLLSQLPNLNDE